MLETTDWDAGLRDRMLAPDRAEEAAAAEAAGRVVDTVRKVVFPFHGLQPA